MRSPSIKDTPAIFEQYTKDEEVTKYMTWRSHYKIESIQLHKNYQIELIIPNRKAIL